MTKERKHVQNEIVRTDAYNDLFGVNAAPTGSEIIANFGVGDNSLRNNMYINNSLARRIIDVVPEEAVRSGFQVQGIEDDAEFQSEWDALKLDQSLIEMMAWDRLAGGAVMVALVKDGRTLRTPVKESHDGLETVRVYERDQVSVEKYETNARSPRYGKPVLYSITHSEGFDSIIVHYSRVCVLDGNRVPSKIRKQNNGFGASELTADLMEAIHDYSYTQRLATKLLQRKQQGVWKARGLADLCDDDEGVAAARLRLAQVDENGGVGHTIGIDANDEEYEVLNSDIAGVTEFLDGKMNRIVALSGIHEIILKNLNAKGLNQSQNTALESFNKLVSRKQKDKLQPVLEFLIGFMIHDKEWSIVFNPLSVPSNKERAEVLKLNAESLGSLKDKDILSQQEVRDTLETMESGIVFGQPPEEIEIDDEPTKSKSKAKSNPKPSKTGVKNNESGGEE